MKRYKTKKEAEKKRKPGFVSTWRGPSLTETPGWYNVSRIRGKRK